MTTLSATDLATVCGGYQIIQKKATPAQEAQFNQCVERAQGKSAAKPWTWSRKSAGQCFGDLIRGIESNPGKVVEERQA